MAHFAISQKVCNVEDGAVEVSSYIAQTDFPCVTDMEFLINNTTQMTFNRVYWAPIAMESAS